MASPPDDDAPDLRALFEQTSHPSTPAQQERWARHAASLPDQPRRRRWWWFVPAATIPAMVAMAIAMWSPDDETAGDASDAPSTTAAIAPVPNAELAGLDLLLAAADDEEPKSSADDPGLPGPRRIVIQDPLRVLDGLGDPLGSLELLRPPPRRQLDRQLAAFEATLEEER